MPSYRALLLFSLLSQGFAVSFAATHTKLLNDPQFVACKKSVAEWSTYQKTFFEVVGLDLLAEKAKYVYSCAQNPEQATIFRNQQLAACLQPILNLGKISSDRDSDHHEFTIDHLAELRDAVSTLLRTGNLGPLQTLLEIIPGADLVQFRSDVSSGGNEDHAGILASIPQKDGSTVLVNAGGSEAIVPLLKLTQSPVLKDEYATFSFKSDEREERKLGLSYCEGTCVTCHVAGFIKIEHKPGTRTDLISLLKRDKPAPEIVAALNQKLSGNYRHETPANVACLGPPTSNFRKKQLAAFLQDLSIQDPTRIEAIGKAMNCSRCHDHSKANPICFQAAAGISGFDIVTHVTKFGSMPPENDFNPAESAALQRALRYELLGELDEDADKYAQKTRGLFIDSLLKNPCPER